MNTKTYYASAEGWIDGVYKHAGEPVTLTDRQAEHLLIAGVITTTKPAPASPAKGAKIAAGD